MGPRPERMSSEASHSDNAENISYARVGTPHLSNLLGCNRLLGMIKRSETMEIAVDANVLVEQTRS